MNLNIDPEWLKEMAEKEAGMCVSVGGFVTRVSKLEMAMQAHEFVDTGAFFAWAEAVTKGLSEAAVKHKYDQLSPDAKKAADHYLSL